MAEEVVRECGECGEEFRPPWVPTGRPRLTCSDECRSARATRMRRQGGRLSKLSVEEMRELREGARHAIVDSVMERATDAGVVDVGTWAEERLREILVEALVTPKVPDLLREIADRMEAR